MQSCFDEISCDQLDLIKASWLSFEAVGDRKFRNCFVQSRNAVRITENSLDLSQVLFAPPTRQEETVLYVRVGGVNHVTMALSEV